MGQKIHPIGFRLGISRGWDSTWYGNKFSYSNFVKEDHKIRNKIMKVNKDAGITKIEIERSTNEVSVKIFTSRPGIVIGRGGQRMVARAWPGKPTAHAELQELPSREGGAGPRAHDDPDALAPAPHRLGRRPHYAGDRGRATAGSAPEAPHPPRV